MGPLYSNGLLFAFEYLDGILILVRTSGKTHFAG